MRRISFRDPLSEVYIENNKIIRKIKKKDFHSFNDLFEKNFYKEMVQKNWVQKSDIFNKEDFIEMTHSKIENFTEVTEMSSYQLFLSGIQTLNIAIESLKNDYMLKDASAWNVVFSNGKPLFLDVASFEKWDKQKTWLGYGQFIRHYIIPLILNKELKIPTSKLFLLYRDGVYPRDARNKLGIRILKSFIYLEYIFAPTILKSTKIIRKKEKKDNPDINKMILLAILKRLKKKLLSLEPKSSSFWTNYSKKRDHYSDNDIEKKKQIIKNFLKENKGKVLDIGCNTGEFLFLASQYSSESYGIDIDEDCINHIQKNLGDKNISVANVNISNPTPSIGWRNKETTGYLKKNINYFDTVIFFGIIHHLMILDRIPLNEIILLLLNLTKKNLVLEFVSNQDQRFLELASVNINLYKNFTKENFEKLIAKDFKILEIHNLEFNKNRFIYILEKIIK